MVQVYRKTENINKWWGGGFNYCQCCTEINFVNRVSHMLVNLRFSLPNWTNISGTPQLISISWVPFILWVRMLLSMGVGFPSTCMRYQPHNLLRIWVWSLRSPPLPPPSSLHPATPIFMIITQQPQGSVRSLLGSCLPVTFFFSSEVSVFL